MKNWIKRKLAYMFASKELDELERWRVMAEEQRRWLAEFPDVAVALDNLIADSKGLEGRSIHVVREEMRRQRDARLRAAFERGHKAGYDQRHAEVLGALV